MFLVLGICLSLASLLLLHTLAAVVAAVVWRFLARPASRWSAASRSQVLFALHVLPLLSAIFILVALVIPAYIKHEPRDATGELSPALLFLALVSAAGICRALWRGGASWLITRRLLRDWMQHATPLQLNDISAPAYLLNHQLPLIALVGIVRPRLFVSTRVFDSLNHQEFAAAVAHETGHFRSSDNLKRALVSAFRNTLIIVPFTRSLDRAWRQASEEDADEYAASAGAPVALNLAAALIKLARLMPAGAKPSMPAGAAITGESEEGVAARVRRLLVIAESTGDDLPVGARNRTRFAWCGLAVVTIVGALTIIDYEITKATHAALEQFVDTLR